MDGIITIVVIAAAVVFKLVSRNLSSAAGDEVFPTITVDSDLMEEQDYVEEPAESIYNQPEPVVVDDEGYEEAPRVLLDEPAMVKPSVTMGTAPILVEEQPKQKDEAM